MAVLEWLLRRCGYAKLDRFGLAIDTAGHLVPSVSVPAPSRAPTHAPPLEQLTSAPRILGSGGGLPPPRLAHGTVAEPVDEEAAWQLAIERAKRACADPDGEPR